MGDFTTLFALIKDETMTMGKILLVGLIGVVWLFVYKLPDNIHVLIKFLQWRKNQRR